MEVIRVKKLHRTTIEIVTLLGVVLGIITIGALSINSLRGGRLDAPRGRAVLGIENSR